MWESYMQYRSFILVMKNVFVAALGVGAIALPHSVRGRAG